MKKGVVVFPVRRDNRWSYIALAASIETQRDRSFHLLWLNLYRSHTEGLLKTINQLFRDYHKIILAYSFMTPQWSEIKKEWELIRRVFQDRDRLVIVAGGAHPSGAVKEVLEGGALGVFVGEGEENFPQVLELLMGDSEKEIPAGFYKIVNGKVGGSSPTKVVGWEESFPFPTNPPFIGPLEITRGCPFKCSYCATSTFKGISVRHRTIDVVLEAVRFMIRLGKKDIRFITPNALSYGSEIGTQPNVERLGILLDSIRSILPADGRIFFGSFPSEVRPEFVNVETVSIMKTYCANRQVIIGAQSGSDRMLELMRRGHTVEDVLRACDILIQYDFVPVVDMIFGLPYEEEEDRVASINLMERLSKMGVRIHAHYFIPLPGSRWGGLSPTPIPHTLRRFIEKLISKGRLFGQWLRQESISASILERIV
ncbi:MAG: TIGR04013 family B12-binding domain/radical SAM domain-containing protein [Syntrophobacterales bacterium]|nr:TIGR04013 family B12-binding domain/radical SAM domain-containing protein [Syntrophobacterales bacterium]